MKRDLVRVFEITKVEFYKYGKDFIITRNPGKNECMIERWDNNDLVEKFFATNIEEAIIIINKRF